MLIRSLEVVQQGTPIIAENNFPFITIILLLNIVILWRYIVYRKRSRKQAILLAEQSKHLEAIQTKLDQNAEIAEREEHFQKNLQHAEMSTELQKSRSSTAQRNNSQRPPERYEYARSMFQSGMATEEISSALGMSNIEITQLLKLSTLREQAKQFENNKNIISLA